MSTLEDVMPEIAGVFAAQESAMTTVVRSLSKQIRNLANDNLQFSARVKSLETSLLSTNVKLQQQQADHESAMAAALQATTAALKQQQAEHELALARLGNAEHEQLAAMVAKLEAQLDERLQSTINSTQSQSQQIEESLKTQLGLLDKKFEYLSRVKTEIKDLMKRMDKQEQGIDDMQESISMLAKSVGTNEIFEEEEEENEEPIVRVNCVEYGPRPLVRHEERTKEVSIAVANERKSSIIGAILPVIQEQMPIINTVDSPPDSVLVDNTPTTPEFIESIKLEQPVHSNPVASFYESTISPTQAIESKSSPESIDTPTPEFVPASIPSPRPVEPEPINYTIEKEMENGQKAVNDIPESDFQPPTITTIQNLFVEEATKFEPPPTILSPPMTSPTLLSPPVTAPTLLSPRVTEPTLLSPPVTAPPEPFPSSSEPVSNVLPPQGVVHMTFSATSYLKSRRLERSTKRKNALLQPDGSSDSSQGGTVTTSPRMPLTSQEIKQNWRRMYDRVIQLRRLQKNSHTNGPTDPSALFRKQNMSMSARVKRVEEMASDLEHSLAYLEQGVHKIEQYFEQQTQFTNDRATELETRTMHLKAIQQEQEQVLIGMEERMEVFDVEIRRYQHPVVKQVDSDPSIGTTQLQDLVEMIDQQSARQEQLHTTLQHLMEKDVPTLSHRLDGSIRALRTEMETTTNTLHTALQTAVDHINTTNVMTTNQGISQVQGDLLILTSSMLFAVDLLKSPPSDTNEHKTPVSVSIDLLRSIVATFETKVETEIAEILDPLHVFSEELSHLKAQLRTNHGMESYQPLHDHLVVITTKQLRMLEHILMDCHEMGHDLVMLLKDVVIQMRSVLFLLSLYFHLHTPFLQFTALTQAHETLSLQVKNQEYKLTQISSMEALIKLVQNRVDEFGELLLTFAKDEDIQRFVQDLTQTKQEFQATVLYQMETTTEQIQQLEDIRKEIGQWNGKLHKKLDKEDLLYTQERMERNFQTMTQKHSKVREEEMHQLYQLVRTKVDQDQVFAMLHEQLQHIEKQGNEMETGPLIATRCISCSTDLATSHSSPPTLAMLQATLKEQVQHEVARVLTRYPTQQQQSIVPSFQPSTHRHMEKHKKELLLAALQHKS